MANLPLVYPASIGFSLEWVLAFTKSITWLVCRIAGLFYALWETTLLTLKFMEERKLCSQGIIGWENVNKSPSSKWKGTNCASPVTVHINQGSYLTAQSYLDSLTLNIQSLFLPLVLGTFAVFFSFSTATPNASISAARPSSHAA